SRATRLSPHASGARRALPPFPTRRSSDLHSRGTCTWRRSSMKTGKPTPPRMTATARGRHTQGSATKPMALSEYSAKPALLKAERSEEHTSELQSRENLVCRLLLEKKNRRH